MAPIESRICVWNGADSLTCDAVAVGLLRDNVEHFVEYGVRGVRFHRLHALADAPWATAPSQLNPSELRTELLVGWDAVWRVPTGEIVAGLGTRALLAQQRAPLVAARGLSAWLCRSVCFTPSSTLGELVANLVHELSVLAAKARPRELIQCATPQMVTDRAILHAARSVSLGPSGPFLP
ncbi:MAG TPA: hypothetical protein VGC79_21105 [Polyangiaceae bacterium]